MESRLDIFIGCMWSGKTSALLRKLTQFSEMGLSVLYINHSIDDRSDDGFSTHCRLMQGAQLGIASLKTKELRGIDYSNYQVIGIDEAQFFGEELVQVVRELVDVHKKYVIVVGLDGDIYRKKFGYVLDLIPLADNVSKLHAYCKPCSEEEVIHRAIFSYKYTRKRSSDADVVDIGGADKYIAVCRDHYLKYQDDI